MNKQWVGDVGPEDDFGDKIENVFYDGMTRQGPWAIMTPLSWRTHGVGQVGLGRAQKYALTEGRWLKVEG